jgi:Holliday junction resolvasome RuvABC endonuclease subunit
MIVYGIDPGTTHSGLGRIEMGEDVEHPSVFFCYDHNNVIMQKLWEESHFHDFIVGYEWVQNYGRVIGEEVLRTAYMCGRMRELVHVRSFEFHEPTRPQIVNHFTGVTNAKKPHVRQAILDRFGGSIAKKKGNVLNGISNHMWDGLAICMFIMEGTKNVNEEQWRKESWGTCRL